MVSLIVKRQIKMLIDKHGLDINSEHGYVDNGRFWN